MIGVSLVGVGDRRAVVAGIADAIAVGIGLAGVGDRRAVVAGVADAVGVLVRLRRVGNCRTVVAGVVNAVAVAVPRNGVGDVGTFINRVWFAVAVTVHRGEIDLSRDGTPRLASGHETQRQESTIGAARVERQRDGRGIHGGRSGRDRRAPGGGLARQRRG